MKPIFYLCLSFFLLASSWPAWACSCVEGDKLPEDKKIARSYTQATLVLTGRVLKAEPVTFVDSTRATSGTTGRDTVYTRERQEVRYTFEVINLVKGQATGATVEVVAGQNSSSCGVRFAVGKEYLIYGYTIDQQPGPDGTLRKIPPYYATSLCHRHQELKAVKSAELRQLRRIAYKASGEHRFEWFELLD